MPYLYGERKKGGYLVFKVVILSNKGDYIGGLGGFIGRIRSFRGMAH